MIISERINLKLWDGVNRLRGSMDASRYKDYVLGIMFYKFLSDKALEEFRVLSEQIELTEVELIEQYEKEIREQGEELQKRLQERLGYYISPNYLYQIWIKDIKNGEFTVNIVMDSFNDFENTISMSSDSNDFKGIFSSSMLDLNSTGLGSSLNERSENIIKLIELFDDLNTLALQKDDILGDMFEYLVGQFAMESGRNAGEFYTPQQVREVMAQVITKTAKIETIYDPTVGSGSLLLTVKKHLSKDEQNTLNYYGQEINRETYNLTRMNLLLHNVSSEKMMIRNGNTLSQDWPKDSSCPDQGLQFDAVVMNPPYSVRHWNIDNLEITDPRFGIAGVVPPNLKGDFAFLLHGLYHLKTSGIMAIALPHSVLSRGGAEGTIRKKLVESGNIYAVISLPTNIFTHTGMSIAIIILKKNREGRDIHFIDADDFFVKEKNRKILTPENIEKIIAAYTERKTISGYTHVATFDELRQNDFNLHIHRYVSPFTNTELRNAESSLADVAEILGRKNVVDGEGNFFNALEMKYPLVGVKKNGKGVLLSYGDIIILNSGKKYLFYEKYNSSGNFYFSPSGMNDFLIIRPMPDKIAPEALYLYLETEVFKQSLKEQGKSRAHTTDSIKKLPIIKELPNSNLISVTSTYREIFFSKYYNKLRVDKLEALIKKVEVVTSEKNDQKEFSRECVDLISSLAPEGRYFDYKLEHHECKASLLHDIICMANNIDKRDGYIIFGIEDKTLQVIGIENSKRRDSTYFTNILSGAKFAYGKVPRVRIEVIYHEKHEIDVLVIEYSKKDRPYFLTEDYKKGNQEKGKRQKTLKQYHIYSRESDSNTPVDENASLDTIASLWKERYERNKDE